MLFAHIHEAGLAFRSLNALAVTKPDAQQELATLRTVFTSADPKGVRQYVERVRMPWAFQVVDDFAKRHMVDAAGGIEELQRLVGEANARPFAANGLRRDDVRS